MRMDELFSRRHLGKTWHVSAGLRAQAGPSPSKRLEGKTVPHPRLFSLRNFPGNPAKLAAVPAGRTFLPGHRLDVAVVQRGCRPEAVEQDADRAAIAARANDDPFPAGEIWASRRAEYAHPDADPRRQPFFGWRCRRSRRTESHCGTHLLGRRRKAFGAWRETHRRTMRLTDPCGREASSAVAGRQQKHPTIEARLRAAAKSAQRMSAVRACRHICACNMHALDVSSYLAISTIDAVASRWVRDGREKEHHSALEPAAAGE